LGSELYETHPGFREWMDRCAEAPKLFALQYSLSVLWRGWGVEPRAVWGEGVGEIVANCVSGALSLEEGLRRAIAGAATGRISAVNKKAAMEKMQLDGCGIFLEIGLGLGRNEWEQLLDRVAELYTQGVELDWTAFDRGFSRRRVELPTYPFQRERYWPGDRRTQRQGPHVAAAEHEALREAASGGDGSEPRAQRRAELLSSLTQASAETRRDLLLRFLTEQLRKVLGAGSHDRFDAGQHFAQMGLDSLMAIELKTSIGIELGYDIPLQKFAGATSLGKLTRLLVEESMLASVAASAGEIRDEMEEISL
jgi:acyl transferase domain-containing protein